ncbi:transcription termination/antitermination protein NusA [Candidatus Microgenomates bacterium]|nr:transcription termination/antitermination protein NusA [Candidatus Microgenomates bacterium]
MQTPRTEFAQALKAIATERGLDANVIVDAIKQAIVAAFRRDAKESGVDVDLFEYEAELNSLDGGAKVFSWGPFDEEVEVEDRKKTDKTKKDVTPPGFGRIAAQTAKQVIHQKIREAERGVVLDEFEGKKGNLVSGIVLRFDGPIVRVDLGRTEGIMPAEERIPSERLAQGQRLTFLLKDIVEGLKGKDLILSRSDPSFVVRLFAREVPEINAGTVEIKEIAREAGVRTKMAVYSSASGVDPVGSCVGQKGVRVQAVTNELGGERVDLISYSEDIKQLIASALSPADGLTVKVKKGEDKEVTVIAPEDQLSLAIGKDGQNVRLASKLTGYRIEVEGDGKPIEEKVEEGEDKRIVKETKDEAKTDKKEKKSKKPDKIVKKSNKEDKKTDKKETVEEIEKVANSES